MRTLPPPVAPTGDPDERNIDSPAFQLGTLTTIVLAHDYICPWCWVGFLQAKRLSEEFGVRFDWRGAELVPPGMEIAPRPANAAPADTAPKLPSRFDSFLQAEGIEMPSPRPSFVRSHNALLGAEFAREAGVADDYHEAVYRAFWERREDISDLEVLVRLAQSVGLDSGAFAEAVRSGRGEQYILPFDDGAYQRGIRHVPTFIFGAEELLAEANYADLARATERFVIRVQKYSKG